MDLKMLMSGIDFSEIENHLKEVIEMVKEENKKVSLLPNEDKIYILLDIKQNDIIAYKITTGAINISEKNYLEIKRTLGKWSLKDLKNLVGEGAIPIENTLKRLLPIIYGFNSLIKLEKNEKRVSIQLDIKDQNVIAYQVVLGIVESDSKENILIVKRILGKYDLQEYLKTT